MLLPEELAAALDGSTPDGAGLTRRTGQSVADHRCAGRAGRRPPVTVVVAQQFDTIEDSQRILGLTLLATYPLLLAVLALIAWRVIGAALRPVEALRSTAERDLRGRAGGRGFQSRSPATRSMLWR